MQRRAPSAMEASASHDLPLSLSMWVAPSPIRRLRPLWHDRLDPVQRCASLYVQIRDAGIAAMHDRALGALYVGSYRRRDEQSGAM